MMRLLAPAFMVCVGALGASAINVGEFPSHSGLRSLDSGIFNQLGSSLYGAPASSSHSNVEFGTSVLLANGGSRLAVGAPRHDWSTPDEDSNLLNQDGGAVFLYDNNGTDWELIWFLAGNPQERIGDRLGLSADGSRIAVRRHNPNGAEIYDITPEDSPTLVASISSPYDGFTVSLSPDGTRLALSSESFDDYTGRVEVFQEGNPTWNSIGTIDGVNARDRFGWMTSFSSSGERLAVSSPNYDEGGLSNRGSVNVFDYDSGSENWFPVGQTILGDERDGRFGFSMAMSGDGSSLVVGTPNSDTNGRDSGKVSVYGLGMGGWNSKGSPVDGAESGDRFGRSVSIAEDGDRIAASSYFHDDHRGQVRVFEYIEMDWTLVGPDIDGTSGSRLGFGLLSVTMSGDGLRLAAGSALADNSDGRSTGSVRVFEAPSRPTDMPSATPSLSPTTAPSDSPTRIPSTTPTFEPTFSPSSLPTSAPSVNPTTSPSVSTQPSASPSTPSPIDHTAVPSASPSHEPSAAPSDMSQPPNSIGEINTPIDTSSAPGNNCNWKCALAVVITLVVIAVGHFLPIGDS